MIWNESHFVKLPILTAVEGSLEVDGELDGMLLGFVDTLGISLATFVGLELGLTDGIAVG